jgi:signal transduction histidine kinase
VLNLDTIREELRGRRATRRERRYGVGLHVKLVIAGALTTFVGIGAVSALLVVRQAATLQDEIVRATATHRAVLIERARSLGDRLGASVESAVANADLSAVADSIELAKTRNSDLAYALLTNADGKAIIHTDRKRLGETRDLVFEPSALELGESPARRAIIEIVQPIEVGTSLAGNLVLAFDLHVADALATEARQRGERNLTHSTVVSAVAAAIATLLCVIVSILLSRRFLAPIVRLAEDAAAIADGNLDCEVRAADEGDEIGFLARQFEMMRRSVKAYIGALVVAKQKAEAATREEKRLRAQLEEHSKLLEAKVRERTAELQEINTQLTEYDRMKSEFLSNVSHELRSPLAAIASAAKIIGRYGDENRRTGKKFSSVILHECDRLARLINDLLDLAKIEAGKVEWNLELVENPWELLSQVVETFRPLAEERAITLELDGDAALPPVVADRDRLVQVLTNLCSNALKFTPDRGRINVSGELATHDGARVVMVRVQDTGPGIPSDQLDQVFDRFHQVKVLRDGNKPKGTGLGLAICREVLAHHGGEIWAEAPGEGGARMVFFLPTADDAAVAREGNRRHDRPSA